MTQLPEPGKFAATTRLYLRPASLHAGAEAKALISEDRAFRLAGGPLACSLIEVILRDERDRLTSSLAAPDQLDRWIERLPGPQAKRAHALVERLREPRGKPYRDRPQVMGILNVTPDSFSDGGLHMAIDAAAARGSQMIQEGADIVDVGGESTRPGAMPVAAEEELRRVLRVIETLAEARITISIDTRKAAVMQAATKAGASIINDVSGLTGDPASLGVAAASGARIVLMHMQGEPSTMQRRPTYAHAALDVLDWLETRIEACERAGIPRARLIVDPGICFGKTEAHNLELLRALALFHGLGCPLLLGVSRKGWTGSIEERHQPKERLPSSLAAAQWGFARGVQIVRVHDVAETGQAIDAWWALAAPPA